MFHGIRERALYVGPSIHVFSSASEPAFGVMLAKSVRSCLSFKSYGYSRAFAAGSSRQIC